MRCLRMIAAASACLGIMPGVSCTSPHAQVYTTVDGAWLALFASIQGMTARLSQMPGAQCRAASDLGQRNEKTPHFVGGQSE